MNGDGEPAPLLSSISISAPLSSSETWFDGQASICRYRMPRASVISLAEIFLKEREEPLRMGTVPFIPFELQMICNLTGGGVRGQENGRHAVKKVSLELRRPEDCPLWGPVMP